MVKTGAVCWDITNNHFCEKVKKRMRVPRILSGKAKTAKFVASLSSVYPPGHNSNIDSQQGACKYQPKAVQNTKQKMGNTN